MFHSTKCFYETFLDGFTHVNIDLEFFFKSSISSKSSGNLEPSVSGSNRDRNPPNTETEILKIIFYFHQ